MWWKDVLAFYTILPAAATFYFFVFWRWFDFWKARRTLAYLLIGAAFGVLGLVVILGRGWSFAGRFDPAVPLQVVGWALIIVSAVFGTVADRQIGFRVRSFTPFFEEQGHIDLK